MWIALALLTALCTALRDAASKHAVRRADPIVVAFGMAAVPAVLLGGVVLYGGSGVPAPGFATALVVSGGINALATPLIVVALQRSDLSLVAPVMSLTPLFMLPVAALVLGERPGPAGAAGVAVIVGGAYLLSVSERHAGALAPFRALLRDPGARVMLAVAFLYSISATFDKVGTTASSPLLWAASIHMVTAAALAPLVAWRLGRRRRAGRGAPGPRDGPTPSSGGGGGEASMAPAILLAGAFTAVAAAAQMTALMLTLAAYVIAVKRISTLFGVLLGRALFQERRSRERLVGAAVMLAGFLLITLA